MIVSSTHRGVTRDDTKGKHMSSVICRSAFCNPKNRKRVTAKLSVAATSAVRAELTGDDICSALGVTVQSPSPVLALCQKLVETGRNSATSLEVYRGDTLCLRIKSIGEAAQLEPSPSGVGFVKRHSRLRATPPAAQTAPAGHPVSPLHSSSGGRARRETRGQPFSVKVATTTDLPTGEPQPPAEDGDIWQIVHRLPNSTTLWRKIFLRSAAV